MLALRLYQLLVFLAAPFLHRRLARRAAQGREDPARLREKFGHAALKRPPGHLVWLHAASVGETNSILPLVEDILTAHPAQQILLTTGTLTSAHIVARWQSCAWRFARPSKTPIRALGPTGLYSTLSGALAAASRALGGE